MPFLKRLQQHSGVSMETTFNYSPRYVVTAAIASKITRIYLSSFPGTVAKFSIDPVHMAGGILTARFIRKTLEVVGGI